MISPGRWKSQDGDSISYQKHPLFCQVKPPEAGRRTCFIFQLHFASKNTVNICALTNLGFELNACKLFRKNNHTVSFLPPLVPNIFIYCFMPKYVSVWSGHLASLLCFHSRSGISSFFLPPEPGHSLRFLLLTALQAALLIGRVGICSKTYFHLLGKDIDSG